MEPKENKTTDVIDGEIVTETADAPAPAIVEEPASREVAQAGTASDNNMLSIIERVAMSPDANMDKLEKMLELQERFEAKEAKKSFFDALSAFQSDVPTIVKSGAANFEHKQGGGSTSYTYAKLEDITETIKPFLVRNGLTYRWEQTFGDAQSFEKVAIKVECIVSHRDGHSETTMMVAYPDLSGKKNPIQSQASTLTYLRRYTLTGALGLAVADEDNDAADFQSNDRIAAPQDQGPQYLSDEMFEQKFPKWEKAIQDGKREHEQLIATVETTTLLTDAQKEKIRYVTPF